MSDVLSDEIRTAAKHHRCEDCGRRIRPGDKYRNRYGGMESYGKPFDLKTCMSCEHGLENENSDLQAAL